MPERIAKKVQGVPLIEFLTANSALKNGGLSDLADECRNRLGESFPGCIDPGQQEALIADFEDAKRRLRFASEIGDDDTSMKSVALPLAAAWSTLATNLRMECRNCLNTNCPRRDIPALSEYGAERTSNADPE